MSDIKEGIITNKKVILRSGREADINKCTKVNGYWYLLTDKNICLDNITNKYILKDHSSTYIHDYKNNKPIFKLTHVDNTRNLPIIRLEDGSNYYISNSSILKDTEFVEDYYRSYFIHKNSITETSYNIYKILSYSTYKNPFDKKELTLSEKYNLGIKSPTFSITEGINYKFGVELEVSHGNLPLWKVIEDNLNLSCVRDGSIRRDNSDDNGGPEYVTGVLSGDTGIQQLQRICLELAKRTRVNKTTGLHIHIGNIDFTKQFIVNSYILCLFLESEILSLVPESRRNNVYCRNLKPFKFKVALNNDKSNLRLEEDYITLFKYMSVVGSEPSNQINKETQHPMGSKCRYDHSTPRYCWLNYIPAMFNTRENSNFSIEIRNHPGSTNFKKIKNWLLLFMAIFKFVDKYPERINKNITINEILDIIYPKKSEILKQYFESRKQLFSKNLNEDIDESKEAKKSIKQLITS